MRNKDSKHLWPKNFENLYPKRRKTTVEAFQELKDALKDFISCMKDNLKRRG